MIGYSLAWRSSTVQAGITAAALNEEDNRIVGFGLRLTADLRIARADPSGTRRVGGHRQGSWREHHRWGEQRAERARAKTSILNANRWRTSRAPAADTLPRVEGRRRAMARTCGASGRWQSRRSSTAWSGRRRLEDLSGRFFDRFGHRGKARRVPMAAKCRSFRGSRDKFRQAADLINRTPALHRAIDLAQPLARRLHGSETVMMLPEFRPEEPAPARADVRHEHARGDRAPAYELAPPPSPPRPRAEKHAKSLQAAASALAALAARRPAARQGRIPARRPRLRYDRTADEATGARKDAAACERLTRGGGGRITAAAAAAAGRGRFVSQCARTGGVKRPVLALSQSAAAYSCSRWWVSRVVRGSLEQAGEATRAVGGRAVCLPDRDLAKAQ